MKTRKKSPTDQRLVLAGMIMDSVVLSRVAPHWPREGLFDDPDANLIGRWCVDHLKKYGSCPNGQLQSIFDEWAERENTPSERSTSVERKLQKVSDDFDLHGLPAPDYVLDRAGEFFTKVKLKREIERAEFEMENGSSLDAYQRLSRLSKIELGIGSVVKLAHDFEMWRDAIDIERERPLLSYPGRLREFFSDMVCRDSFIAFEGPAKSFKSFWLMDAGFRAIHNRRRVAMFEVGDMSRHQIMRRMAARIARRPIEAKTYRVPKRFTKDGEIQWEMRRTDKRLTPQEVFKTFQKACRGMDLFRLSCHSNSSIDVFGVRSILERWAREGWTADVILIDYADILAPPKGINDKIEQIDTTWKQMRAMSQDYHCLVMTASQTDTASYTTKGPLARQHFSGSRTKNDHINGMVGLNVTAENRTRCVTGLNWIERREGRNNERFQLYVAGCLDIANPAMKCREFSIDDNWDAVQKENES